MEEHLIVDRIVLIAALGIGAHWLAWRFHMPVIVLLTAAGLIAGPGMGWLQPQEQFGDLLQPIIGIAVAVILFEGGLHLLAKDLRGIETPVRRLVLVGASITWGLGAASAHWLAGVSWPVALLLGGILVVTGPTVIIPLLLQAKLDRETASVLKWEGIVNDPLGALLAVLVFEYITVASGSTFRVLTLSTFGIVAAGAIGYAAGRAFAALHASGHIAEYLKGPFILGLTLVCYLAGNTLQAEAGLVAVTVLGMTLANSGLADIDQMRRLKEYVTVILASGVFILLSASLEREVLGALDWGTLAFVCAILFVVRPVSVFAATLGTSLSWRQRLFLGWIAPRGIVAVSMAGLFAGILVEDGFADGSQLVPLVFSIVVATVVLHGFTMRPLGRLLGLAAGPAHGVLIVGATRWSAALAATLKEAGNPVLVSDGNVHRLGDARRRGIETFSGEILSELADYRVDLGQFEHVLAATDDDVYNALVCTQFAAEFGPRRAFQLAGHRTGGSGANAVRTSAKGQVLMAPGLDSDALDRRMREGWRFDLRKAAELDAPQRKALADGLVTEEDLAGRLVVAAIDKSGEVRFNIADRPLQIAEGERVLVFQSPGEGGGPGA
jgi:NhaP-type Na+/H+ or K+/H+ antiporter